MSSLSNVTLSTTPDGLARLREYAQAHPLADGIPSFLASDANLGVEGSETLTEDSYVVEWSEVKWSMLNEDVAQVENGLVHLTELGIPWMLVDYDYDYDEYYVTYGRKLDGTPNLPKYIPHFEMSLSGGTLLPRKSCDVTIDSDDIARAEQCLIDNGIAPDEAKTVLQAIGYMLLDTELYAG